MAKGKHSKKGNKQPKKSVPQIRLNNEDFKSRMFKIHGEDFKGELNIISKVDGDKLLTSKLFTPEMRIVSDPTEEEKSLMKESDSDTLVEFIISTGGVDRDGDTIDVDGWSLSNFHKNPVVPWAHDYGQPPVARAIDTRKEDGDLKSKAMFTGKELYPFGHMIGKMYTQKFLNAVSVGFNPSKFVFVEDSERKFGIDFLEQELLEYSAVPVPSNPEALIQARSKGIDIMPMKDYLEELLDSEANRKNLDMEVMENLIKVFSTKTTTTVGDITETKEDTLYEIVEDEDEIPDSSTGNGDSIDEDPKDTDNNNDKDTDSLDNTEDEEKTSKGKITVWMNDEGTIIEVDDAKTYEHITLEDCIECSKNLLSGEIVSENVQDMYKALSTVLKEKYGIGIFDFKYVDSKSLKNFPERFSFDEDKCLLTEKSQMDIENGIIKEAEEIIAKAIGKVRKFKPNYEFKETNEETLFEIDDSVVEDSKDNSDLENVINFKDINSEEELKSFISKGVKTSSKITFDKSTGKLN